MFDFFEMEDNYEERKIDNTEIKGGVIDTCAISDSDQPFETGIQHPSYNDVKWVIVEMYGSKEMAQEGHDRWVRLFNKELPKELVDVSTSNIALMCDTLGGDIRSPNKRQD